jgi:putative membrane fusion protein
LIFAFAAVVVANVFFRFGTRLETTIVRHGMEENSVEANGYIFRDQTVITAPTDGYLYCEVPEDERVGSGEVVMYIYKNEVNLSASSELKKVEEQISELSEGIRTAEIYSNDTAKIEQTISQNLKNVPKAGARGNIAKVDEIAETVDKLIEKRRIITGEIEAVDRSQEIKNLKEYKAELEKKYNIERTLIHAPRTGAFTSRIDGLEEKLNAAALENINSDYIKQLDKMTAKPETKNCVAEGEPIGKIVNNFMWSLAVQIPQREAEGIKVGKTLQIRFLDVGSETISGTVTKITPEESGKVILVLSTNKYVESVYSMSKARVQIVKASYDGFRIPAKSLRMKDGEMGVYVIRSNKARFIPVKLLYNGKTWVVVSEIMETAENPRVLKLYDELVVRDRDIYEGKVMR